MAKVTFKTGKRNNLKKSKGTDQKNKTHKQISTSRWKKHEKTKSDNRNDKGTSKNSAKNSQTERKSNNQNLGGFKQVKSKHSTWKKRSDKKSVNEEDEEEFEVVEKKTTQFVQAEGSDEDVIDSDSEEKTTRKLVAQQNRKKKKPGGFQSLGLSHNVFKGITRKGYKVPTPIQRKTIPLTIDGKDVVAMARTGSGKTAAFLIPMFEKLQTHTAKSGARALILSPTRELALQTLKFTKELGKFTGLRAAVVLGGDRMEDQFAAMHENPDIIIATPGRFMHIVVEMDLKLKSVQYVVFDEADRLFEMGFHEQLQEILHRLPDSRQTLLFSATLPKLLVDFAKAGLHDPTLIRLDVDTKLSEQLKTSFFQCRADDKVSVLLYLLRNVIQPSEQTVVFAATKHHVEYLNLILKEAGIVCTYIYSSLDQTARKINIGRFQHRRATVLIVTDLAARGIDIPLLDNVINFHFPAKPKLFVHRVGRVARAGRSGTAYSLIANDELPFLVDLHLFLGRSLNFVPRDKTVKDEDGLYGKVPQSIIDDIAETLHAWHDSNFDIQSMVKVCVNAYGHYIRSRPAPAQESIKRVKEMDRSGQQIGIHPVFGERQTDTDTERTSLLNALKSYKANSTIFEVNATAKTSAFNVMKKKRKQHQTVIEKNTSRMEDGSFGALTTDQGQKPQISIADSDVQDAFSEVIGASKALSKKRKVEVRDEENYLQYRPADYRSEQGYQLGSNFDQQAGAAVLDLAGDDQVKIQRKKGQMRWDRKKKKYVRDNDDPKNKKIRTESGAYISASYKSNVYKEWMQKSKHGAANNSDDDEVATGKGNPHKDPGPSQNRLTVIGGGGKRWHKKGTDGHRDEGKKNKFKPGRSELKRPEQILKARKQKAKKQHFQESRESLNRKRKSVAKQRSKR